MDMLVLMENPTQKERRRPAAVPRSAGGRGDGDNGGSALRKGRCEGGSGGGCSVVENGVTWMD